METAPLSSPATSIETTAQAHVEVDEARPATLSTVPAREEASKEFRKNMNGIWTKFHETLAWIARQEADVQHLWRYGKEMHVMYTTAQRQLAQVKDTLSARTGELSIAKDKLSARNEELSVANATIELLKSDCAIYSDGADALAETIDNRVNEIQRLTRDAEGLQAKLEQMEVQNQALRDDLSETRNLLQAALEAQAEPSGRAARKKRKL